ncbi:DUF3040 domain-containing protein [Rhodococcus opacus]|uniref:DUF3040 domain-containing protein n=1 Tax=Rhodococcus opacus TaxID=37919 RepID=UPI0007CD9747|nr:DUF3040 domain-containing protein [Rhodococcus opacus]MDX5969835.1 DUF3040 domain-containing protein [Rhodococcus opacus]MDX5969980.1 DUF3040 domain-containing protein [Rhodococcus opacus]CAG7635589.1 hypothetical protein E143388_07694 [Rhodococcus opacus]CAG7642930.1 hypothetical protein E143388_08456 [Rhodococcus opacus]
MLSADERNTLCEIEQRLLASSPTLVWVFHGVTPRPPYDRSVRTRLRVLVLAVTFGVFALLGPRVFNAAEIAVRKSAPTPRTTRAVPTINRLTDGRDPGSASVIPVDTDIVLILDPSTTFGAVLIPWPPRGVPAPQ